MALTVGNLSNTIFGNKVIVTGTVAFDSSYPTGGESLTAANIGINVIDYIQIQTTAGLIFEYNYTSALLLAYLMGVTTGSSAATSAGATVGAKLEDSQGAQTVARLLGTSIDVTYDLGFLKQVPNTTDLSTITGVRFFAIGA